MSGFSAMLVIERRVASDLGGIRPIVAADGNLVVGG